MLRDLGELQAANALPSCVGAAVRRVCASHRVAAAFDLRVELVNYKKVVLHLFNEGGVVEKDLRQLSALLHCPLAEGAAPRPAQLAYASLSAAVMDAKGSRTAMQDARVFTKTICTLSRHPAARPKKRLEGLPTTLVVHKRALSFMHWVRRQRERAAAPLAAASATMPAGPPAPEGIVAVAATGPEAPAAEAAVEPTIVEMCAEPGMHGTVLRFLRGNAQIDFSPSGGPASRWLPWARLVVISGPDLQAAEPEPEPEPQSETASSDIKLEGHDTSAWSALCADLHGIADVEAWPAYVLRYVLQLLIVRGAAKALQMSDALRAYVLALSSVPTMLKEAEAALLEIRGGNSAGGDEAKLAVDGSGSCGIKAAVAARRQLQLLRGLHAAAADNAHWTATLLSRFGEPCYPLTTCGCIASQYCSTSLIICHAFCFGPRFCLGLFRRNRADRIGQAISTAVLGRRCAVLSRST